MGANGLLLDGVDDHAATTGVPVDTTGSFTVTGWAQAAAAPTAAKTVLSAAGAQQSAFQVRYVPSQNPEKPGRWQLALPGSDSAGAAVSRVENEAFDDVQSWNHLALVYDGFRKEARLYVNGQLEEIACADDDGDGEADDPTCVDQVPWGENVLTFKASASLDVGRAKTGGMWGEYWPGAVDDVWTFQGALSDAQVGRIAGEWFELPTDVPDAD